MLRKQKHKPSSPKRHFTYSQLPKDEQICRVSQANLSNDTDKDELQEASPLSSIKPVSFRRKKKEKMSKECFFRLLTILLISLVLIGFGIGYYVVSIEQRQRQTTTKAETQKQSHVLPKKTQVAKPIIIINQPKPVQHIVPTQLTSAVKQEQLPQYIKSMQFIFPFDCREELYPFHVYYPEPSRDLLYRTRYNLFFPVCDERWFTNLGRQAIEKWNQERQIIQWSKKNIRRGDKVLYDCPKRRNWQEITILSRLVGPQGELWLPQDANEQCLRSALNLNSVVNVRFIARGYRGYTVVISSYQAYLKPQILERGLTKQLPYKMLVYAKPELHIESLVSQIQKFQNITWGKIKFNNSDCKGKVEVIKSDGQQGYYQIMRTDYIPKKVDMNQKFKEVQHVLLPKLRAEYQKYLPTLPSPSERKNIGDLQKYVPLRTSSIKGLSTYDATYTLNEIQIIFWVQNRTDSHSDIYYNYNNNSLNAFVLINIATLVPKGKIKVVCQMAQWHKLQLIAAQMEIKNIERVRPDYTGYLEQAQLIITDNIDVIKQASEGTRIKEGKYMLAYFNEAVPERKQLIYQLNVRYHLRKVGIFPSLYFGFQIFDHFFWYSDHPTGLFEVQQASKYWIFAFWSKDVSEITPNRKFDIQQLIWSTKNQVRIITPVLRPYYILPEHPLHKAFPYLSAVHQGDYLRIYFGHFYGGAYTDIKHTHVDLLIYLKKLYEAPQNWQAGGEAYVNSANPTCNEEPNQAPCKTVRSHFRELVSVARWVMKKQSNISSQLYGRLIRILDNKYQKILKDPARAPRDGWKRAITVDGKRVTSQHPIRWQQLGNEIFGRTFYNHRGKYFIDMPQSVTLDYRDIP